MPKGLRETAGMPKYQPDISVFLFTGAGKGREVT
jgi:hypothetical protein